MIQFFYAREQFLQPAEAEAQALPSVSASGLTPVWVDLLEPTAEEIAGVDTAYAVDLPTQEEMRELEISSRLYEENEAQYMTITYIANALGDEPQTTQLTFVLRGDMLLTMRHKDIRILSHLMARLQTRGAAEKISGVQLLLMILEGIIELCSDVLEKNAMELERIGTGIFAGGERGGQNYQEQLRLIARVGELNSKIRESLVSVNRMNIFLSNVLEKRGRHPQALSALRTFANDIHSLLDHAAFLSTKITFLLDATLGLVNIEQNAIIKIFSVAAVIFLPPTLIASIYGMNFSHMPELAWGYGYPFAVVLMIISAVLPYWYFKYKRWL